MSTYTPNDIIHDNGGNAFLNGLSIEGNPHWASHVNEWTTWRKGWRQAKREALTLERELESLYCKNASKTLASL